MTRGTAATLTREVPGNALFFTAYEAAQMSFPRWIDPSTGRSVTDGELIGVNGAGANNQNVQNNQKSWFSSLAAQEALASVVCGGLAGSAFWLAMLPIDLAKTRYQIAHPGDVDDVGVWRLIRREMLGRRGVRGLWIGTLFILIFVWSICVLTGKCFVYFRSWAGVGEGFSDERGAVRGVGGCVPAGGCAAAARGCRLGLRRCH